MDYDVVNGLGSGFFPMHTRVVNGPATVVVASGIVGALPLAPIMLVQLGRGPGSGGGGPVLPTFGQIFPSGR